MRISRPSPSMIVAMAALVVAATGTAFAAGEGSPLLGGERNPGKDPRRALTKETGIIANTSGYGTRQSNKSSSGGGAIYGCRSGAGGTAAKNEPCIRANNLSNGLAFEFATTSGDVAGRIDAKDANSKPFTTNATGVATGLNADRVDGQDAEQIVTSARAGYNPVSVLGFVSASAENADEASARAAAKEEPLGSFGPFTVYAKCFVDTDAGPAASPEVNAAVYIRTTQNGTLFDGQSDLLDGDPAFLNTDTAETDREVDVATASTASLATLDLDEDPSGAVATDGKAYQFRVLLGAKTGALAGGNGIWGDGNRCAFAMERFNAG